MVDPYTALESILVAIAFLAGCGVVVRDLVRRLLVD